jgi:hypothetical protein
MNDKLLCQHTCAQRDTFNDVHGGTATASSATHAALPNQDTMFATPTTVHTFSLLPVGFMWMQFSESLFGRAASLDLVRIMMNVD